MRAPASDLAKRRQGQQSDNARQIQGDRLAADLLGLLQHIRLEQMCGTLQPRPLLAICVACGSLERADRPCELCAARRARRGAA